MSSRRSSQLPVVKCWAVMHDSVTLRLCVSRAQASGVRSAQGGGHCFGTRARFLPAPLLRRKSGGRFDGSAFEQVGSGPFREPGVGAGAGDVDGQLLRESCDLG